MRILCGTILAAAVALAAAAQGEDFARWVNPFIGTAGDGNCFPGPCRPFGMVQPSPDTGEKTHCGGYKFTDETIRHFSQTHLNGTGRPAMGDMAILPVGESQLGVKGGESGVGINKVSEVAEVGYYAVTLGNGVKCEATATERVAVWRFTWPDGAERGLSVDAAAMLMQAWNQKLGATVPESSAALREDRRGMTGYKKALGWTQYKLFYAIEFSEPWANIERLPSDPFQGKGDRWIVEFDTINSLEVRIALSTVSEDGAVANMKAEADGKTFDDMRAECRAAWNEIFSRAQLVKGTDAQKTNWYTALYHLCIQPNIQTDVDGKYRGADDAIHTAKRGHYSTFSLWDTFRAAHPLYTIIVPERVPGFVDSLVAFGEQHGHLPMWTMWNGEDHCMVGIHSIPVIVDAYKKGLLTGLTGLTRLSGGVPPDPRNPVNLVNPVQNKLLTLMVQSMINNDGENPKNCWNAYWENGYIPYRPGEFDKFVPKGQSVSTTLELAYDWWCIADFAKCIGDERSAAKAQKWADCWKNVFDKEIGFARPRAPKTSGGAWREPFDPCKARVPGEFWSDYTEATPWVYAWHVFQDPDALAEVLGGREKALAKLDEFFATLPPKSATRGNSDEGGRKADGSIRAGQIGQYWHGNEPSHHIAYLYSLWGRRDKTAELVRKICREAYRPVPDGLCGNDDCGQMSAWYIFSMMGFYPVNPCGDGYVLGEAQAEEVKLRVGSCESRVGSFGNSGEVLVNGKVVDGAKISHDAIIADANTLTGAEKSEGWQLAWDGKTFDGWVAVKGGLAAPPGNGWVIEDGTLSMRPVKGISADGKWFPLSPEKQKLGGGGDIVTVKKYRDFMFKFDFCLTSKGNSGVKYFYDEKQNGGTCEEYQILDEGHPDWSKGKDGNRRVASLYDIFPANAESLVKPVGEWNHGMIVANGPRVEHWLNGKKVLEYDRTSKAFKDGVMASKYAAWGKSADGKPQPWGEIAEGRILLQDHADSTVYFRNLKIKELNAN